MSTAGSKCAFVAALLGVATASSPQNKVHVCVACVCYRACHGVVSRATRRGRETKIELVPDPASRTCYLDSTPAGFHDLRPGL